MILNVDDEFLQPVSSPVKESNNGMFELGIMIGVEVLFLFEVLVSLGSFPHMRVDSFRCLIFCCKIYG